MLSFRSVDKMIEISANQVTPEVRSLFRQDEPQAPRCFRVLDGVIHAGKIITDNLETPTWAVVQEPFDQTLYFGGAIDAGIVATMIARLRLEGDVLVGMWLDDPRLALLPGDNYYDGRTLEFYDRPIGAGLAQYLDANPAGCELVRLDKNLVMQTEWGPDDVRAAGGLEIWEKEYIGYGLLKEKQIVAEAAAGPPVSGMYEPGVFTHKAHRKKGYGTIVSARLIHEIENRGGQTYWNCAKQNTASAAIARKLGYRIEKEYRCIVWRKSNK